MAIELIGLQGGHPEHMHPSFVNPSVIAVLHDQNLEKIVTEGLHISDSRQIPAEKLIWLIQTSETIREASQSQEEFKEVVVYLGKKRDNNTKIGAIPYVGVYGSVPVPFAGNIEAILSEFDPNSDIFIIHLHPSSPEASDSDLKALLNIYRDVSLKSSRKAKAHLLIIGEKDKEEILYTFDSTGKNMTINLGDSLIREKLRQSQKEKPSQPPLDRLHLLKYKGSHLDTTANKFQPRWHGDSGLFPEEIPGIGLLFPGYLNNALSVATIPDNSLLAEPQTKLYVARIDEETGKVPIVYIEQNGVFKPLIHEYKGIKYGYILNGIPYFPSPESLFPNIGTKIVVPQNGIKIADYEMNLTGGRNTHKVDIIAVPIDSLSPATEKVAFPVSQ